MTADEKQLDFMGVTQFHNAGIKGRGINILNCESYDGHGRATKDTIYKIAPEANIFSADIGLELRGDTLVSITLDGHPFEQYLIDNQIKVISLSQSGNYNCQGYTDEMKRLRDKYNLIIFNSAGNNGYKTAEDTISTKFPAEIAIVVGALYHNDEVNPPVWRAGYSSYGPELDFMAPTLGLVGTSFAAPFLAGMAALLLEKFGDMSQAGMYELLKMLCIDIGEPGEDIYTGWGVPILPYPRSIYVQHEANSRILKVNGKTIKMDTCSMIQDGRILLPMRAIAEALGCKVEWMKEERTAVFLHEYIGD